MAFSDPEVTEWLAEYGASFEADVERAERAIAQANQAKKVGRGKTRDAESHVSGDLHFVKRHHEVPTDLLRQAHEPMPGKRDRNWFRDLGRRTAVRGRERIVLDALLDRVWTGENNPREGRYSGQWTGYQREIKADIGDALGLRSIKYAVVALVGKGIITRRFQGRRRAAGGGRGKSVYYVQPANPYEIREGT